MTDTAKSSIDSLQVTIKMERDIILNTGSLSIPSSNWLIFWYNIFFISVELCFILLALKEYLQDFLGIEDKALIDLGIKTHSIGFWFANLEWNVDFNKGKDKDWTCILSGPYCSVCGYLLKYIGQDNKGVSIWECYNKHQAYIEVEPARLKQLAGDYAWKFKPEKTYSETEVNEMITRALNKFKSELRKKERTIKKDGS